MVTVMTMASAGPIQREHTPDGGIYQCIFMTNRELPHSKKNLHTRGV